MKKIILSTALIALGSFAMAQQKMEKMEKRDPAIMEQRKAEKMKVMQQELNLTEVQMSQISAMQAKRSAERQAMAPQVKAERAQKMEMMKAKKEDWNNEFKRILTPEQYKKWEMRKKDHKKGSHATKETARMHSIQQAN